MLSLIAALTLATSTGDLNAFSAPPLIDAEVALPRGKRGPHLGLTLDVGLPEGAGASLTFGPWRWLRLQAGPAWNGAATGLRGGVTLIPLQTFLRPTLSVHGGLFPEGDAQGLVRTVTSNEDFRAPLLSRVAYDFVSAQAGIEIGSPAGTSFFLRAGVSRTVARFPAFEDAAREALGDPNLSARTPVLTLVTPSVQLGLSISLY